MRLHKYLKMYFHLYIYIWGTTQFALTILHFTSVVIHVCQAMCQSLSAGLNRLAVSSAAAIL